MHMYAWIVTPLSIFYFIRVYQVALFILCCVCAQFPCFLIVQLITLDICSVINFLFHYILMKKRFILFEEDEEEYTEIQ